MPIQVSSNDYEGHPVVSDLAWKEVDFLLKLNNDKHHVYFKSIGRVLLHVELGDLLRLILADQPSRTTLHTTL